MRALVLHDGSVLIHTPLCAIHVEQSTRWVNVFALDPATHELFGYAEIESEERWNAIASTDVCRRWWTRMADLMPANPDHSPRSSPLREVFHLD